MMCVGRAREEDKVSSCLAAPGAPLVVDAHLAGLLSWGYGCGYENDLPLIYTSTQYYQSWLLHNIPLLRRVSQENLTILFEGERGYILSKWLQNTRIISPEPFTLSDKPMEILEIDKQLAKLKGNVYDIRDLLFDGIHHKYKTRLYKKLRQKIYEKMFIQKIRYVNSVKPIPFLNMNDTMGTPTYILPRQPDVDVETLFVDEMEKSGTESDTDYKQY